MWYSFFCLMSGNQLFMARKEDDFNLHHYIKAVAAFEGVSTQFLNDRSLTYRCRCSVMWRLGIALYTKAGGVPWALAEVDRGTAFTGIDYALRPEATAASKFAICCSQVFDAEGTGIEFLAYEADGVRMFGKNPIFPSRSNDESHGPQSQHLPKEA